ncbi:transmembrane sensor [Pseudomonas hunanensis]|uniref:Transmembrane sensor n=1 Tax=Pseudomonas hunanensis TaxID=1247546 RepID=A0ACC6K2W7_9PSED|nr:FecR domain-containing protein [Pseudomonas hunanensis]MDR6712696.1 transmembrane sensor [Pseudomonas hunanensis]
MSRTDPITADPEQAALSWLSRINQHPAEAQGAAFKRWLLADPAHRQAYAQAQALWRLSEGPAAKLALEQQASLQPYLDAMRQAPTPRPWLRRGGALAAAACLVLALGSLGGWQPQLWLEDLQADYTSSGQVRQVTLADQSQMTLDAGSAVAIDFAQGERRVRLLRGAAFFQVTHTGQPFLVEAAGGEVRVLGTQFEVRDQDAGAQVTVRSGRVAVSPGPGQAARELTANQQVAYVEGVAGDTVAVDSDSRLAWRQGWLNYYQVPLAQVVEELRRYYPGRIVLLDAELGQRKVSGSFPVAEPLVALDSLGKVMGFSRNTVFGRLTLLR